jgi:hypothetical protein
MHHDKEDKTFPAIGLADAANIGSPTKLHRRKLKELAEWLDQFAGSEKPQVSRGAYREAC